MRAKARRLPPLTSAFRNSWWACHLLGGIAVAVNAWLPPKAFFHCITITDPTVVLVDEERQTLLGPHASELKQRACRGIFSVRTRRAQEGVVPLEEALKKHSPSALPEQKLKPEVRQVDPSFLRGHAELIPCEPTGPRDHLLHLRHHVVAKGRPLDATAVLDQPVEHGDGARSGDAPKGRQHSRPGSERSAALGSAHDSAVPCHGCAAPVVRAHR